MKTHKLTDRLIIILCVAIILIISLFFANLCMFIKLSKKVSIRPKQHQVNNSIEIVLGTDTDIEDYSFDDSSVEVKHNIADTNKKDTFNDLCVIINELELNLQTKLLSMTSTKSPSKKTLGELLKMDKR